MTTIIAAPFAARSPSYAATSTTSQTIVAAGNVTFTVSRYLAYTVGVRVRAFASGYSVWMEGVIIDYTETLLTIGVDDYSGSGTYNDWTINLAGQPGFMESYPGTANNASLVESNATDAVTFSVKTEDGGDPSVSDSVRVLFQDGALHLLDTALSQTIPQGITLDTVNSGAFRLWLLLIYQSSGPVWRLGVVQTRSSNNILTFPFSGILTYPGNYGSTAGKVYTNTSDLSGTQQFIVLGMAEYDTGLTTAGNWSASPTRLRLYGPRTKLPGEVIQVQKTVDGSKAYTTVVRTVDDTVPTSAQGTLFLSQAITPRCPMSVLSVETFACIGLAAYGATSWVYRGSDNALATTWAFGELTTICNFARSFANTTSSITFSLRMATTGSSVTRNGNADVAYFGGVGNTFISVSELQT